MMFFGIMGMLGYANDPEAYDSYEKFAYLAFFDLLAPLADGWHILVLILVTALSASSIDSLQTGLGSMVSHDLVKLGWNPWWVTRAFVVLVNIPAVWLASKQFSVLELFLVADLACATAVFPTFLGLQREDIGILVAPTELGAFGGIISGMVAVLVNGIVNDIEGGLWSYFWLRNGDICALCGPKTMVTFLITPTVSGIMTYVLSYLDVKIRGDRARQPIFPIPFDKETDTVSGEIDDGLDGIKEKSLPSINEKDEGGDVEGEAEPGSAEEVIMDA
jgi:solute:Na+ symporter, SSS family